VTCGPDRAKTVSKLAVGGVGLLRAEFVILSALEGKHPRALLQDGRGGEFVERMAATCVPSRPPLPHAP
jgi:pyruvate, water dikinase